jgi:hypothetical protein
MGMKLNSEMILTTDDFYWINAHTNPPPSGATVQVLNQDGIPAGKTTWNSDSIKYFDGWLPQARIPADIRAVQVARYKCNE